MKLLLAFLISIPLLQAPTVSGSWKAVFDADMRRASDDEWKVNKRSNARLILEQRGDSVFGTWQGENLPDPAGLRGTFDGKTLRLTSGTNERVGQVNGQPVRMKVRQDFTATLERGALKGVLFIHIDDRPAPARKWEATR